jgi:hypothetical protein
MSQPITLDDIFALFRESEQERKEYQRTSKQALEESQRAFEERQRAFEEQRRASQLAFEEQQRASHLAFEEQQRASQCAFEERQRASQRAFEERQRAFEQYRQTAEQEMNRLREQSDRTDQQIAQTDEQMAKTDQQMAKLIAQVNQTNKQVGGLTSRWGEFVENLIKPAAARLFQEKGIEVHLTALRVTGQDDKGSIEIDILVENTTEIVAIEVKSHLEIRDVKRFLQTLERFKQAFPKRKNDKLYGAVAGIKIDERVNEYAIQEGLFLIQPAGDSVIIANSSDFKPKAW